MEKRMKKRSSYRRAAGLMLALIILVIAPAIGAEYVSRNMKVTAPKLAGTFGQKMTASGGAVFTSQEMRLEAATITWYFSNSGRQIDRLEASGKVTFHAEQSGKDGGRTVADGEGDALVYRAADGKAVISGTGQKAHVHVVETVPARAAAGDRPAQAAGKKEYDIRASSITYDLKQRSFEASGGVEMEANLPEEAAPQTPAK